MRVVELPVRRRASTMALLLAIVIIPSIVLLGLSLWLGFVPFLLDLDLLVAYSVVVFLAQWFSVSLVATVGAVLVTVVCAVPILRGLGMVYITDPALIVNYLKFWRLWPWEEFVVPLAAVLGFVLFMFGMLRRCRPSQARIYPALIVLVLVQAVDAVGGGSHFGPGLVSLGVNVSTSSAYQVFAMAWQYVQTPHFAVVSRLRDSAADQALAKPAPRILSVAVESWGLLTEDVLNERIMSGLRAYVVQNYDVHRSDHAFVGGTLSGELRELCGVLSRGAPSKSDMLLLAPQCLPARLRAMGYSTFGVHGNHGAFYNRAVLYPELGFDQTIFQAAFMINKSDTCSGSVFTGPCDRQTLQTAVTYLKAHERAFAHVMTLDTHLPLRPRSIKDRDCSELPPLRDVDLCIYFHRFSDTLRAVGELVQSGEIDQIFIYGDHAPPYADARLRKAFDVGQVPMVVLDRKQGASVRKSGASLEVK